MNAEQARQLADKQAVKNKKKYIKKELRRIKKEIKEKVKKGHKVITYPAPYLYEPTQQWLSDNGYEVENRKIWGDTIIRW